MRKTTTEREGQERGVARKTITERKGQERGVVRKTITEREARKEEWWVKTGIAS